MSDAPNTYGRKNQSTYSYILRKTRESFSNLPKKLIYYKCLKGEEEANRQHQLRESMNSGHFKFLFMH